jgi:ParB family transcriptional regulator, chromosome partitioning protein
MVRKAAPRRKKAAAGSVGLAPADTRPGSNDLLTRLGRDVESDGGSVIGSYLDPYGGRGLLIAALPIDQVEPTPYQRDPSDAHVKRLMTVIEKIGRFLDPLIVMRHDGRYWTPNGNHRLQAMKRLGAKSVVALVVPEAEVAFKILALNTEKAHNLREKSLETLRMARAMPPADHESEHAFEFEQAPFLTLGFCYEQRPRFSGGAYQPVLRRIDDFLEMPLKKALAVRGERSARLLEIDDKVSEIVAALKERGLTSPYLRPFVAARINPIRFSKAASFDFDDVMDRMQKGAARFNTGRVTQEDVARMGGGPVEEEGA